MSRMLSPRPEDRCTAQVALDSLDLILASQEYKKLCEEASDEFRVLFPNRKKYELKREVINRHELPLMALMTSSSSGDGISVLILPISVKKTLLASAIFDHRERTTILISLSRNNRFPKGV